MATIPAHPMAEPNRDPVMVLTAIHRPSNAMTASFLGPIVSARAIIEAGLAVHCATRTSLLDVAR